MKKIAEQGVALVDFSKLTAEENSQLEQYFINQIAPLLSPMVVGKRQPFPFLKNKDIYAAVVLESKNSKEKLGVISCGSEVFPRLIKVGSTGKYMLSEELILHYVPKIFKGYTVKSKSLIRVTRNADIDADALYDEDLDYREFMADLIKKRKRLAPVRLELSRQLDNNIVDLLCKQLEVNKNLFSETVLLLICHSCSRYRIYSDRKPSFSIKREFRRGLLPLTITSRSCRR